MSYIKQTIVVVLVPRDALCGEVIVIDPDVGGVLNFNQVLALWRIMEIQVAKDNVGLFFDPETAAGEA